MDSNSTIIKLLRWRVRDLAACFLACKTPHHHIEEEPNCSGSTTDDGAKKTMVFDPIGENGIRRQKSGQKLRRKKSNQEMESGNIQETSQQISNSKKSEDGIRVRGSSLSFKEEEFIVFCFEDDGTIHMVKEKRPSWEPSISTMARTQKCGESESQSAEKVSRPSYVDLEDDTDDKETIDANGASTSISKEQVEGEEEVVWAPDDVKETNNIESHEGKTLSSLLSVAESSDSNHSDGSFAFPVLRWEWMGSPVHMPQPDDKGSRAQKARSLRFHCCGF